MTPPPPLLAAAPLLVLPPVEPVPAVVLPVLPLFVTTVTLVMVGSLIWPLPLSTDTGSVATLPAPPSRPTPVPAVTVTPAPEMETLPPAEEPPVAGCQAEAVKVPSPLLMNFWLPGVPVTAPNTALPPWTNVET